MSLPLILIVVLIVLVVVAILKTAVVVPQRSAYIVERLGKYNATLDAGFHILFPFLDRVAYKRTLKETPLDVPPQQCITKDNITVEVDGIIYLQVMDPVKASYGIDNYLIATTQLAQTTMRSEIGKLELDTIFNVRETMNAAICNAVDAAALTGANWQRHTLNLVGELNLVKATTVLISDSMFGTTAQQGPDSFLQVENEEDAIQKRATQMESLREASDTLSQMQQRALFIVPLIGFGAAQQAAKNNG